MTARTWTTEAASMIPASTTIHSPAVTSTIGNVEVRATEVEVVAVRISGVDAEMPVTSVPVERAIEI